MKKRVALATRFFSYIAPAVQLYLRCAQVIFLACAKSDIATSSQLWNISNSPLAPKAHILILPLACGELLKCNFPFPHVFGLRRLRNAIRLVRFGYNSSTGRVVLRVAPISPFPLYTLFEGTHGVRSAWDNPTLNYSLSIINSQSGFFFITPYCLGYCFGVGAVFSKTKSARFSPLARVRLFVSVCFAHSTF